MLEQLNQTILQFKSIAEGMQTAVENHKSINITVEPPPVHTNLTQEELFRGVSLSEKVEGLESIKKELEDTMQEMEEEANDMNRSIEMYQQRNESLEKENKQLRSTIQQLRQQKQSQWSLKPLGNPFNYLIGKENQVDGNEERTVLKSANEELTTSLQLEVEKNKMLLTRLDELQQLLNNLSEEKTKPTQVERSSTRNQLFAQLTLSKLKEVSLLNTLQKV